ncbi:MAG: hypothetical protein V9E85_06970 [Candidatus Nanopelagicales bacterium]
MSRVGKAAKVSGAVLGAAIVVAVPTFAAAVSAQADDAEVNPAIRAAVVNSALAQPSGGPLGAHVAVGIPIPVAPAPGVAVAAPAQAARRQHRQSLEHLHLPSRRLSRRRNC